MVHPESSEEPVEIKRSFSLLRKKEEICRKLSGSDQIWYATNIEIYNYVEAYKRLQYSANGHLVYNPTLFTIWLDIDGTLYSVKSGETIRVNG